MYIFIIDLVPLVLIVVRNITITKIIIVLINMITCIISVWSILFLNRSTARARASSSGSGDVRI